MCVKALALDSSLGFAATEDMKPEGAMREDMLDVACRFDVLDFQTQSCLHATS